MKIKTRATVRVTETPAPGSIKIWSLMREDRSNERFYNMKPDGISITESHLQNCVFENINSKSVSFGEGLKQSTFVDCIFERCVFVFGAIGNVRLDRCRFVDCHLSNLFGTELEVIDCVFPGTTIKKAVFHGELPQLARASPRRARNEFRGNNFSSTLFLDTDFRGGIDLYSQTFPQGPEYLFIADTCWAAQVASKLMVEWSDAGEKSKLKMVVSALNEYCITGQRSQLLNVLRLGRAADELRQRLMQ